MEFVSFSNTINWSVSYLRSIQFGYDAKFSLHRVEDFLVRNREMIVVKDDVSYKRVTIRLYNKGVIERDTVLGEEIGTKKQFVISEGQFILSKIDARSGAFGLVPKELDGAIVTADFLSYHIDKTKINPRFLALITSTDQFLAYCRASSSGTTGRQRIQEEIFLKVSIPLPSLSEQLRIVRAFEQRWHAASTMEKKVKDLKESNEERLFDKLGIKAASRRSTKGMQFIKFIDMFEWGTDKLLNLSQYESENYPTHSFQSKPDMLESAFRGKSPKYQDISDAIILNQKCNRWNYLELEHAKSVDPNWLNSIEKEYFTKEGDVIVNSTGEGTLGRATYIIKEHEGLLYDSHILLLRLNKKIIDPLFYVYVLNSRYGQMQIERIKSAQSTKQTELGVANLRKIVIPVPPIKIQREMANHLMSIDREIKKLIRNAELNLKAAVSEFEKEIFAK